jgi:hypothetical protein
MGIFRDDTMYAIVVWGKKRLEFELLVVIWIIVFPFVVLFFMNFSNDISIIFILIFVTEGDYLFWLIFSI